MARSDGSGRQAEGTGCRADPAQAALLDARIRDMRRVVQLARPGSHAEALRALREAFPETTLAERVAALDPGGAFGG